MREYINLKRGKIAKLAAIKECIQMILKETIASLTMHVNNMHQNETVMKKCNDYTIKLGCLVRTPNW